MSTIQLRRKLSAGVDPAPDVEAMKRMILDWRARDGELHTFMDHTEAVRQRFQREPWSMRVGQVNLLASGMGSIPSDVFSNKTAGWLIDHGHADSLALHLLEVDRALVPKIVYPIAKPAKSTVCQGKHITSGIPGNVGFDFCAPAGSLVLAVEAGEIIRLSGHDPRDDKADRNGVYGWSVYLRTAAGYVYFITHMSSRQVKRGDILTAGDQIGVVGDQRFRLDHCHYGCTSPFGPEDALKRMLKVAGARKVLPPL